MKKIVLLTLALAIAVGLFSFSINAAAAEVSVQKWQYYEKIVADKIWTVGNSDHERTWTKYYLEEMDKGINDLIAMSEAGNKKARCLVKKMLTAGVPSVVKRYCLRPATVSDYRAWLDGYVKMGGRISNFYDSPLENSPHIKDMWVAEKDFHLARLTGADSIQVIIPRGVRYLGGTKDDQLGHNVFLTMDGFCQVGAGFLVATFSDTGFK